MKKELCLKKTVFTNGKGGINRTSYPCCVYFDATKQACEFPYCYRAIKEKGEKHE